MSDGKKVKKNKKAKKLEIEEVDGGEMVAEVNDELEENVVDDKKQEEKGKEEKARKKEKKSEDNPKKEKKSKKGLIVFLVILVLLAGGAFAAKTFLTKTTVTTETVKLADNARGFSNYFKEYIVDRLEAEQLFNYSYKELSDDTILSKLSTLKDGFSKVSRGVAGNYNNSGYKELAEVMKVDADAYLTVVRELRGIVTGGASEEEKKSAFEKKVGETKEQLRSAVYMARAAYSSEVSGFSSKAILAFEGKVMVEAGGGVANIFVGDVKNSIVAVSSDAAEKDIKTIDAQKLYGYTGARVIEIGESLKGELESGWFKNIKADVGSADAKLETTRVSTILKNVQGMSEELEKQGIRGLLETETKTETENLAEAIVGIKGKQ